jgi:methylenetetrahydrofolate dehydrogenase (NADP+)/methenyltetrahydrofolate cyclohydrolase
VAKLLDGKGIAAQIRKEIKVEVDDFVKAHGWAPVLAVVLASTDQASKTYVKKKRQACQEVGMGSALFDWNERKFPSPAEYVRHVLTCSGYIGGHMTGVLVQLPIAGMLDPKPLLSLIDPYKDVDVFHPENVGLLVQGQARFKTCTPQGILVMLERSGLSVMGKTVCIINSSDIVGKPLSSLMIQAGATVTVCHHHTPPDVLKRITRQSEVVVVAVGKPCFLTPDMVAPGAIVIDVGINRLADQLVGDVDPDVLGIAGWVSPVPGGVGPMTVAMLLKNNLEAAKFAVNRYAD